MRIAKGREKREKERKEKKRRRLNWYNRFKLPVVILKRGKGGRTHGWRSLSSRRFLFDSAVYVSLLRQFISSNSIVKEIRPLEFCYFYFNFNSVSNCKLGQCLTKKIGKSSPSRSRSLKSKIGSCPNWPRRPRPRFNLLLLFFIQVYIHFCIIISLSYALAAHCTQYAGLYLFI